MKVFCHMDAIPKCPKLSHENRGGSYVPSEALNPLPLKVANEASSASFVISNRCISVKFEPARRGFAPKTSNPSSRQMRRWIGCKKVVLKSFGNTILQQGSDWLNCRATLFMLSQMDQIPKRKSRCQGTRWCREASLEV